MKTRRALALLLPFSAAVVWADPAADRKIADAARESYASHGVLQQVVHVEVKDAVVTLTGTVADRDQRALAEDAVRDLPGVKAVDNRLELSGPGPDRADGWLLLKIQSVLVLRRNVSARNTEVAVTDGVVTLTGTVDSDEQKRLTETYVRNVEGVKSVRNQLQVRPGDGGSPPPPPAEPPPPAVDDADITAQIQQALRGANPGDESHVRVETRGGVVTLRGYAGSDAQRDEATRLAESVRGVRLVINELTVEASE